MTIDQLLQEVEALPHTARVQTMIELGQRSRTDTGLAAMLGEMAGGEWYQRFLALYTCFGSENSTHVLAALADPSRILRGLALRLLPLVCNQTQLQQALENAPAELRLPMLWRLAKHGSYDFIDTFVEQLSPDDPQFCQLVGFASELLRMPPVQALAYLQQVPQKRVTVAKETVRLIGDLAAPEAYDALLALEQQKLHHDVRIVLIKTLWKYTQYAQTWTVMEHVIQDPDAEMALAAIPTFVLWNEERLHQRIEATRQTFHQHMLRLGALLLRHPDKTIRFRILDRYAPTHWRLKGTDSDHQVLPLLAEMVETAEKDECVNAAKVLFGLCSLQDSDLVCRLFRAKLTRLDILEGMVASLNTLTEVRLLPLIRAVLDVLATSPVSTLLRLRLAFPHLLPDELFPFFMNLVAKDELHAEALTQACASIDRDLNRFELPTLERLEREFAASEDERLRRLALALLLEQVQRAKSWNAAYRNRLDLYRADRSLMVTTVAQFTFPQEED